jgi:secreted trypsin-like serine protease
VVHEAWSARTLRNDVALCILGGRAAAATTREQRLADGDTEVSEDEALTSLGWGAARANGAAAETLQQAEVGFVPTSTCRRVSAYAARSVPTTDMICAGGVGADACQGDSGGPLLRVGSRASRDLQVGITSFGVGCGQAPGVYTAVSSYRDWIAGAMADAGITTSGRNYDGEEAAARAAAAADGGSGAAAAAVAAAGGIGQAFNGAFGRAGTVTAAEAADGSLASRAAPPVPISVPPPLLPALPSLPAPPLEARAARPPPLP